MGSSESSSSVRTSESEEPPPRVLNISLESIDDIRKDVFKPIFVVRVGNWRCEVTKGSWIRFIAVKPLTNSKFPPHFGLLVENTITLKKSGSSMQFNKEYLLAHAVTGKENKTVFVLSFFNLKRIAFERLRSVHDAYKLASEHESNSVLSNTSLESIVDLVREELSKPFDPNWRNHLTGAPKSGNEVTNCALFSARILYKVTPYENKSETTQNMREVFAELGLQKLAEKYFSDFDD